MILVMLLSILGTVKVDLPEIRELFTIADKQEPACKQLSKLSDGYTMDYLPVVFAYHAAAEMTMANHVLWPGTKLSYFNRGKEKLERVANKYNDNIEIRYIRYAVQKGSPSFLGYKNNMKEDRKFIQENLRKSDLPGELKKIIRATIE